LSGQDFVGQSEDLSDGHSDAVSLYDDEGGEGNGASIEARVEEVKSDCDGESEGLTSENSSGDGTVSGDGSNDGSVEDGSRSSAREEGVDICCGREEDVESQYVSDNYSGGECCVEVQVQVRLKVEGDIQLSQRSEESDSLDGAYS